MSDTPRTDAQVFMAGKAPSVCANFARQLERELTSALADAECNKEVNEIGGRIVQDIKQERDQLKQQLSETQKLNDALLRRTNIQMAKLQQIAQAKDDGKPWTVDDPRMLHEQIRVADVAFNELRQQLLASQLREQRMREALQEEVRRHEHGNRLPPNFYQLGKHFGYCSIQGDDVRSCAVCGTYYKMKDALSTPTDDSLLKEVREALQAAYDQRMKTNEQGASFEMHYTQQVKHALQLLGGEVKP